MGSAAATHPCLPNSLANALRPVSSDVLRIHCAPNSIVHGLQPASSHVQHLHCSWTYVILQSVGRHEGPLLTKTSRVSSTAILKCLLRAKTSHDCLKACQEPSAAHSLCAEIPCKCLKACQRLPADARLDDLKGRREVVDTDGANVAGLGGGVRDGRKAGEYLEVWGVGSAISNGANVAGLQKRSRNARKWRGRVLKCGEWEGRTLLCVAIPPPTPWYSP